MRRTAAEAARTRQLILETALATFAERGYAATSLVDIAARAGLTRGAVYHHFGDKAELYLSAIAEIWGERAGPIWGHLDGDGVPGERLRSFLVAFLTALEREEGFRLAFAVSLQGGDVPELASGLEEKRAIMARWADQLTDGLFADAAARGELREGVAPRTAALAVISAVNGAAATWIACPDLFSPAAEANGLADAVTAGVLRT